MDTEVLILGAGPAGYHAAKAAAKRKARVVLTGAEPYLPYWRPRLPEVVSTGAEIGSIHMSEEVWFRDNGIQCRISSPAAAIDPDVKTVRWEDGTATEYGSLILACGANPTVPSLPFADRVYTLRTYQDAMEIRRACSQRKKAFIVGGGVLGLEAAFALTKLDCRVSVSINSYLLSRQLDPQGGDFLQALLEKAGVHICVGAPEKFPEETEGACVIAATGVRPSLSLAQSCGIATNRGILVNEKMQTNIPGIYACGDVAEFNGAVPGLMAIAAKQGETAGINAAGGDADYQVIVPSPLLKVAGISVLSVGSMQISEDARIYRRVSGGEYAAAVVTGGRLTGAAFIGNTSRGSRFKACIESGRELGAASSFEELEAQIG